MTYVPAPADTVSEAENTFFLRGKVGRMGKLLAHFELYRQIVDMPGAVVELGVYKGASLMRFATFRSLLENDASREVHGFDAFGAFPLAGVESHDDRAFIENFERERGEGIARETLMNLFADKGIGNVHLHEGNIFDTLPDYLGRRPELRIALLHLDVDVYEPTAFALDHLMPHMVPGGLIVFDDYGLVAGATRAAEELASRHKMRFEKMRHYTVPAFLRVPA
ncbi:TylF/MycF/NovP-related O-methyltransferase [Sphingomonas sp. CFBP 8760]|uniref:TylF/MycF/NovP-related O-methyltransferase n=1 Tax=Sphingomonas sp. CFBP 8760 TaxID=2775282 RepID=UPI0017814AC0|nr:TylF/MycF/NovP-related O-methyltransferase [Sphingomonas sp. CFBP 8760]MBD8545141.1 class I SAM-dependent methyltransferase [Sphingomonas sp. CFBP 8760]